MELRRRKWRETGEDCIMRSFIICTLHQILFGRSNQGGLVEGHEAHIGDMRNAYKILVGKSEGTRSLGKSRRM